MTAILDPPADTADAEQVDDDALLDAAVRAVGGLGRNPLGGALSDVDLASSVAGLHRLEAMVTAEKLRRVAEVDRRDAAVAVGARGTDDLLTGLGLTRGEARAQVGTAHALARLPQTAARFAAGQLGAGHAREAARALDQLPDSGNPDRDRDTVAGLDRAVSGQPSGTDRRQLRDHLDRWAHQHAAGDSLAERERRAHHRRHLWAGRSGDDLLLEGRLTPQVYAKLGALLDPLARATGPDDPCTIGQRRHDALATLLDHAAAVTGHPDPAGSAPTHHGGSHVVGPARNDGTPTSAGPETGPIRTRPAGTRPSGSGPAGSGPAGSGPARGSGANEGGSASGGPRADAGSHGAAGDTGDTGGAAAITAAVGDAGRAHVLLITTPDALHGRPGHPPSDLDGYGPVSSETARQICCDADVTTVVVDDDGTPLDLGRTHRLPTRKQRLAVIARDRVCVGCGAPARRCQIHHIRWWRDLGRTDLDNLCLVCPGCHTNIHHFGWTVIRTDGRYRAGPPPPPT